MRRQNSMRIKLTFWQSMILLGGLSAAFGQTTPAPAKKSVPEKPTMTLAIRLPQDVVKVGSAVMVEITIRNKVENLMFLPHADWCGFDVRDDHGNQPLTRKGQVLLGRVRPEPGEAAQWSPPIQGGPSGMLGKNQTATITSPVCDLFDLSKPGTYTIQAYYPDRRGVGEFSKHYDPSRDDVYVKSNIVTVTIVP
jgi:hypothetical protein